MVLFIIPPLFKKAKGVLLSPQSVRLSVRPLCYLLLNHWTKFNQIWYVSYSHEWGVQRQTFFGPWALERGHNVKYHLISITKSTSKICIPNFVCVLTNERYKTYQTGFSFCCLGHAPGVGLWGAGGAQVVKSLFFQTWSCGISNRRGWRAERNASNIFILCQTGDLGARSKGQISLTCQFQRFLYQTLRVFSQIKDRKHIEQNFYSFARVMPRG